MQLETPAPDEFPVHASRYVSLVAAPIEPIHALQDQRETFARLIAGVSESRGAFRYADGKWSVKEVVGHVSDSERVFAYRLLRVARGDKTSLPGFDQDVLNQGAHFASQHLSAILEDWMLVRAATISLVHSLQDADWDRRGTASQASVSPRGLLFMILGHVEHHRGVLVEQYGLA